jgi:hypothetical protein
MKRIEQCFGRRVSSFALLAFSGYERKPFSFPVVQFAMKSTLPNAPAAKRRKSTAPVCFVSTMSLAVLAIHPLDRVYAP